MHNLVLAMVALGPGGADMMTKCSSVQLLRIKGEGDESSLDMSSTQHPSVLVGDLF